MSIRFHCSEQRPATPPIVDDMPTRNPVRLLRILAIIESISFLVLLGIAMPLKYFADMPSAVKFVGWAHGVLFVAFCVSLAQATIVARWPAARALIVFVAALVPFGPFVIDRRMLRYAAEFDERRAEGS
jgi:integral membrane protein